MTVETLLIIRKNLAKVVVHGNDQAQLLQAIDKLDEFIEAIQKVRQAA
jgi:hypothetical protein